MDDILRTFTKGNYPFYLTTHLPLDARDEYVILAHLKTGVKKYFPFLMLVCHHSFVFDLKSKLDFELLLDIEAKKMGRAA